MTYGYECKKCGTEFTISISVKKYVITGGAKGCPVCFSDRIVRDYEAVLGIHYRGKGFTKAVKQEDK